MEPFPDTPATMMRAIWSGDESALERFAERYRAPLIKMVRGRGIRDPEDVVHSFFQSVVLEKNLLLGAPASCRLRTTLRQAMNRYLDDLKQLGEAKKRGGHLRQTTYSEAKLPLSEEKIILDFEREWALAILERVMKQVRLRFRTEGKEKLYDAIAPRLGHLRRTRPTDHVPNAELAKTLGCTEGAIKTQLSRMRAVYGKLLLAEVGMTVTSRAELREEVKYLLKALNM